MFVCGRGVSKDCRQKKCKIETYQEKVMYPVRRKNSKASPSSQRSRWTAHFMHRRWQSRPPLLIGNQGGKALKWLLAHFNFYGRVATSPTLDEAFIYTLSADETSPVFAAPRHTITALFCCQQPPFRGLRVVTDLKNGFNNWIYDILFYV